VKRPAGINEVFVERRETAPIQGDGSPPIRDYGYIADCHSAALISKSGSIDWCCMPRVDSRSCFSRLLGWKNGGYYRIVPSTPYEVSRAYLDGTLILETLFRTDTGEARLVDCFTMREGGQHLPHQQILRIVEGVKGKVEFLVEVVPRFDYGAIKPWIRRYKETHYIAIGGSDGLLLSGDLPLSIRQKHDLVASGAVEAGKRFRLSVLYRKPEDLDGGLVEPPDVEELDQRLEETVAWWRHWASRSRIDSPYARHARRSAIVLKGLTNAPTGAIAAAPTTSLPESPGGSRNWDYRFSWVRDSYFTVRSLAALGHIKEADGFRRFIERSSAGSAEEIQVLFGVGGERRLHEYRIPELEGYRGARPVRVGNDAEGQVQLDVYGDLLNLSWQWYLRGYSPDDDYWEFLVELVNAAADVWKNTDHGIWEIRGRTRHFVYSKAMCWAALDRGIQLAERIGREAPVKEWKKVRAEIRRTIEESGYDRKRGIFVQAFDSPVMDSALLLLPTTGFVPYRDERMIRTVDAIRRDLDKDGLLLRYPAGIDGLEGEEGVFLSCSFWLAECLARQDRMREGHEVFQRAVAAGNELGLFSEEFDTGRGEMLGNFPQGLTHLSLIAAAVALAEAETTPQ
jgi:GH15 family glucan-1,4-alpha-glucosidase